MSPSPADEQRKRDLVLLRRVRDRIDREYAQPLDVEALARGVNVSAGHLSRQFKLAYGESPYSYLMTRRIERAMALLRRGDLSVTEVCFAVGCGVTGHVQHPVHRAGRRAAQRLPRARGAVDGGDAVVRVEEGHPTGQESRSTGDLDATSVTVMNISIHSSFLPHDDPDAALAFYRDTLGFELRMDVGYEGMRWLTIGPPDQPDTAIVLHPPGADPGITDDERRTITEMMAKGTYGSVLLATKDLDGAFEKLESSNADIVQEPTEQPWGVRDCAVRDPAGNMVRIQEVS